MRIIFMGTPDFAVYTLNALINSAHEVVSVFTQPDKPQGRGKKVGFSSVKSAASAHGIPVVQPTTLKTVKTHKDAKRLFGGIEPDCIVVAAYGMILPEAILNFPKYGCLNVHASLLPKYRGAAPINRCIMEGETETGVTIMQMDKGLDTGDMLLSEKAAIGEDMNASELHDVLAELGGTLIVKVLDNIEEFKPIKQNDAESTYAAKLTKDECKIDFSRSAKEIRDFIRGLADYPCAYTFIGDKRVKVYRTVIGKMQEGIPVKCGNDEFITLTDIKPEGGKRMSAVEFLRGHKV
ncbi:MAG: methionyl-tRNA formyltransferase [Oscillospiraceae bacterium]|nr:methionyl-tRNA formyltransferase [Oscillospiraceae bacterium]